ncbi:aminofutalosine deaminase family hydrolase [Hydrogenimonas urashimensis]|uniref:aminofutalosine deaminase family hydrolase n=1 Tax=Hydrogenimonas urashimensis TaxID=2740515 RepID=UPI0019154CB4|nr:metal-dependent hydrolase [Hydrogenimonas urashimensis]
MKIIAAKWLFDGENIQRDTAVAFDEKIAEIGTFEILETRYPDAEILRLDDKSVLLPGLINPHVHLEFGANTTHLKYGDFMTWLQSVIAHRDELIDACHAACYRRQIQEMLETGTTTFGAVSSYGKELTACRAAPQRVIFFNEAIGSQPAAVDALYSDFMQRLEESEKAASDRFIPAVALHAPYSVHPVLIKKILHETPQKPLSAHFLESPAEKEWLQEGRGPFKYFFESYLGQSTPLCHPEAFLNLLEGRKTLLTHAVQAGEREFDLIASAGHAITHCPRSNRLLGCGRLPIEGVKKRKILWLLGTDGLSSNRSLSLWDEMRAALMLHHQAPLNLFAADLLRAVTSRAADALDLPVGRLKPGCFADLVTVSLPDAPDNEKSVATQLVLHTEKIDRLYIQGTQHV